MNLKKSINVVYASDFNYVFPLTISILSFCDRQTAPCTVHLVYSSIPECILDHIKCLVNAFGHEFNPIDVSAESKRFAIVNRSETRVKSVASCYRYFLPELLPNLEKVIYIDADTIIRCDLRPLDSLLIDDECICASLDEGIINNLPGYYEGIKDIALKEYGTQLDGYFNSGVFVLNLKRMRSENILDQLIRIDGKYELYFRDQDVFNIVLGSRVRYLERGWNLMLPEFLGNVDSGRILHFTLAPKPWEDCYFTSHGRMYIKYIYRYVDFLRKTKIADGDRVIDMMIKSIVEYAIARLDKSRDKCCAKDNCFDLRSQLENLRLMIDGLIQSGSANSRKKVLSAILTLKIRGSTNIEKKELRRIQRISCVWAEIAMPEIYCYERRKLQCKLDFFFKIRSLIRKVKHLLR